MAINELREDGSIELREAGGFEIREEPTAGFATVELREDGGIELREVDGKELREPEDAVPVPPGPPELVGRGLLADYGIRLSRSKLRGRLVIGRR